MFVLSHPVSERAFSLVEILLVVGLISALMGFTAMGLRGFERGQGSAIVEVKGFLESARNLAVAQRTDVYVAFSNDAPREDEHQFSRMAMFVPDPGQSNIFDRSVRPVSEWFKLPEGQCWALSADFEQPGQDGLFSTIQDLPENFQRTFPFSLEQEDLTFPFIMFNAQGRVEIPPIFAREYLFVGIVARSFDGGTPVDLGQQSGSNGEPYPRTHCLSINPLTGRAQILSY